MCFTNKLIINFFNDNIIVKSLVALSQNNVNTVIGIIL